MGQALPLAVQHDLTTAPGTGMSVTALVNGPGQDASGGAAVRSEIAAAMPGVPFSFQSSSWSDPLGLIPGALPASPASTGKGNTPLLQAASMSGIASHATLIAGRWPTAPTAPTGSAPNMIAAALPAAAAALLHVSPGDVLRLRDRLDNALLSFRITGVFVQRAAAGPADSYWSLSYIPASGVSASYGSSTYGPLVVSQAAFGSALAEDSGSWLAQPDMKAFPDGSLAATSARVAALAASLPNATFLNGAQLTTSLPAVLTAAGSNLTVAWSLLVISALQILVLAMVALAAVGRLLAAQREGETALLIARGATRSAAHQAHRSRGDPVVGAGVRRGRAGRHPAGRRAGRRGGRWARRASGWRAGRASGPTRVAAAVVVALIAVVSLLAPGLTAGRAGARRQAGPGGRRDQGRP